MTAWTDHLAHRGATLGDDARSASFADATTEARSADGTIAVPLLHLGTLRAVGPDSTEFLHNLVSNDVKKLPADGAEWNSFNSPKGRMIASFLLWSEPEGHAFALSADILPAFLKKLSMYVLRSKVKLSDARADTALIGLAGPDAAAAALGAGALLPEADMKQTVTDAGLRCIRLSPTRYLLAAPIATAGAAFDAACAAGATAAGTAAWQLDMVRAGLPLITAATQEEFVAQMLNYELIGGVNFHKGCYPGQEIVARTQYLGKLKKRTYRVALPAGTEAGPGTDLYAPDFGEQSAGKLVNVAPTADGGFEALAVLQCSSAEAGEVRVGAPDGPRLSLLDLPYALA